MLERITVHVRHCIHDITTRLQELLTSSIPFSQIVVRIVGALMNLVHRICMTRIVVLRHLHIERIVHRQRVTTLIVHALAKIDEISLDGQTLQRLFMCWTIAQLHDGNRVTVEVAVEALDHVWIHTHTRETIIDRNTHVTHTRITKNGVTPHKRVITVTQMQFLRQLRANTDLVDVQTRITRPHSRRRMRQTRSHETFLEDIALTSKPATHDVLCNAIVRSLSAMHRLSHRSTSIGKILAS